MTSVLFVCTRDVFRSVTAEYALRAHFRSAAIDRVLVSSPGTMDAPGATIRNDVAAYLATQGMDVSGHRKGPCHRRS